MERETNTETVDNVEEKPYVLHELQAQHLFLLTSVISKLDLKSLASIFASKVDMTALVEDEQGENDEPGENDEQAENEAIRNIGYDTIIEIVGMIIDNLPNCQKDLFKFLAAISNLNEKQVAALPLKHFVNMVSDVVRKDEFADFFTACAKFLK